MGRGSAGRTSTPIKVLGEHPALGGKVEVFSGRYGPYIKFGKVNATLPKDMAPEAVTMDDALKLIAARMESGSGKKKKPAGKAKAAKPEAAGASGKSAKAKPAKNAKPPKAAPKKVAAKIPEEAT